MTKIQAIAMFITGFFAGFVAGALAVAGFAALVSQIGDFPVPEGLRVRPCVCRPVLPWRAGSGALPVLGGKAGQ